MQRPLLHFIALQVQVRMLFLLTMVYLVVQLEDHAPLRSFRTSRHGRVDCPVIHLHATCLHLWEVGSEELEGVWVRVRVSGAVREGNVVLYWRRNGQCCMVKGN